MVGTIIRLNDADGQTQPSVDRAHHVKVAFGKVVVDRDHMAATISNRMQVGWQRGGQSFPFAGFHFGNVPPSHLNTAEQLNAVCAQLSQLSLPTQSAQPTDTTAAANPISVHDLNQFAHEIHRSIDLNETCVRIANDTRKLLDCDRVTVIQAKGRPEVKAVSGQATVNRRSNVVQSLQRLVKRVLPTKQTFWFPAEKPLPPQIEKLLVTSPRNGTIVTWNLESRFQQRPVNRGELLLEVVNVDGPWQVELLVADRHAGHLIDAAARSDEPLTVEFILAAAPAKTYYGTIEEIGQTMTLDAENGPSVKVLVATDSPVGDIQQMRSGVNAKIICGKSSLGYSCFHGVGDFIQKHWFQLF